MARIAYRDIKLRPRSLARLVLCNSIIDEYLEQGLRLTLRQLYYQLVARNIIPNREKEYRRLATLISDGRLAGLVDWRAIEDRGRQPRSPSEFENLGELVDAAMSSYRLPRWRTQARYVELWVEKDALAGVLAPLAYEYHVTLMVNRGYSSQSAMYEAAQRFIVSGKPGVLLYLGDHDPSGEDMVRDIQARLDMFEADVEVRKVALTMAQIDEHHPPPNPAKLSDPRAAKYVDAHGGQSWEVDALNPPTLAALIRREFRRVINPRAMAAIKRQEDQDKARLQRAMTRLTSGSRG